MLETDRRTFDVLQCSQCGFGWTEPKLDNDELGPYYAGFLGNPEKTYQQWKEGRLQRTRSWKNEIAKTLLVERYVRGGRLLDAGCGDAKFLLALDPHRWKRSGLEMSEETVRLLGQYAPDLDVAVGTMENYDRSDADLDVVTLWHVLEHLQDPRASLLKIRRWLRPKGRVFISLPNLDSWQARHFRTHWFALELPRHLWHFSPRSLARLVVQCGFAVGAVEMFAPEVDFHSLKHSWLYRLEEHADRSAAKSIYYLRRPLLPLRHWWDRFTRQSAVFTMVCEKDD